MAASRAQEIPVLPVLHALGHGDDAELARHVQTGVEDGALRGVVCGAVHEAAVELELGEGDVAQLRERGMAGAEVVDGQSDALESQPGEDLQRGKRSEERRVGKECRSRWWPYEARKETR